MVTDTPAASAAKPAPGKRRLLWLLGALVVLGVARVALSPVLRRAQISAERDRREIEQAQQSEKQGEEIQKLRRERRTVLEKLAATPEDPALLLRAGSLYAQDRRYEDALFVLNEARRLEPDNPEPYRGLQECFMSLGQYDRAYDAATEGLKRAPHDLDLVLVLGHLDSVAGWNRTAVEHLHHLDGTPQAQDSRALALQALVHRQVADTATAVKFLNEAAQRTQDKGPLLALLSGIRSEQHRADLAEQTIREALKLDPHNSEYLLHLAGLLRTKGTPEALEDSRRCCEEALKWAPGSHPAFLSLALTLLAQKRTEEARSVLEELVRRDPSLAQADLELGRIYLAQGRTADGGRLMTDYRRYLRMQDEIKGLTLRSDMMGKGAAPALAALGRAFNRTNDFARAVLILRRALQLDPHNELALTELRKALRATNREADYPELAAHPEWHLPSLPARGA